MQNLRRAFVAASIAVFALVGCASPVAPETPLTMHLDSFNDGFKDSKQDDCEQGFKPACAWLAENH